MNNLVKIKNIIWVLLIIISLLATVFSLFYAMFTKYNGPKESLNPSALFNENESGSEISIGSGNGISRGELKTLFETEDEGEQYVNDIYYLLDSTLLELRSQAIVDSSHVWGTSAGNLPIANASTAKIKFPNDGSEITADKAAMIVKPKILYIAIGSDGLANVSEEEFIAEYETLIANIRQASPDTVLVLCGTCSVSEDYSSVDGLDITKMSDGNDWIQLVCRDTGAFYLDIGEPLGDGSGGLRASYCGANGKTLNRAGLTEVLQYIRTHAITLVEPVA